MDARLAAVARTETYQRAVRRADPRFAGYSDAAISEQVTGIPVPPRAPDAFGWALAGEVWDFAADERREVWWHAATDRVKTRVVPWVPPLAAEPGVEGRRYWDGARLRWVELGTGEESTEDETHPGL